MTGKSGEERPQKLFHRFFPSCTHNAGVSSSGETAMVRSLIRTTCFAGLHVRPTLQPFQRLRRRAAREDLLQQPRQRDRPILLTRRSVSIHSQPSPLVLLVLLLSLSLFSPLLSSPLLSSSLLFSSLLSSPLLGGANVCGLVLTCVSLSLCSVLVWCVWVCMLCLCADG